MVHYAKIAAGRGLRVIIAGAGGRNAGLLAVQILGASDATLRARLSQFKRKLAAESATKDRNLQNRLTQTE